MIKKIIGHMLCAPLRILTRMCVIGSRMVADKKNTKVAKAAAKKIIKKKKDK